MKAADWIIDFLISKGATDAFGLPGVVILDLIYAMDRRKPEFTPHLSYHEQGAAFAACGYAQTTGKLGVAYATRGPGFTNLITAIADAYYDSLPVMFFSAHTGAPKKPGMRIEDNQEMDSISLVSGITKYAVRIDKVEDLQAEIQRAYEEAMGGRTGPVFLDILSSVFEKDMVVETTAVKKTDTGDVKKAVEQIAASIERARHPVFLIGNGVRHSGTQELVRRLAESSGVPILSSRTAQDILSDSQMYFGYVGSHATRYSNFILSKADLIIALGNRLAFPVNSLSFRPVVENASIIRVDVDENEFLRNIPNSVNFSCDLRELLPELLKEKCSYAGKERWLETCKTLKETLLKWDMTPVISTLIDIINSAGKDTPLVCDVGNHSFWMTIAYAYSGAANRIIYSGSFGSLGSALPKAVGACVGLRRPVMCFTGDQGFQMNIQELQFISRYKLPVNIVVLNNLSSGMIREREEQRFGTHFVHTTQSSGYSAPDIQAIAQAYKLDYRCIKNLGSHGAESLCTVEGPCLTEVLIDEEEPLFPLVPRGNVCQDMAPKLPRELYMELDKM